MMESTIHQVSKSAYVIVGPEGATNFSIVKGSHDWRAVLVDADIRRIDEIEEALKLTGCSESQISHRQRTSILTTLLRISIFANAAFRSSPAPAASERHA